MTNRSAYPHAILVTLAIVWAATAGGASLHPLGYVFKDPRIFAPGHEVSIAAFPKRDLPPSVDHTPDMPPVDDQGSQGSCTAWASAYYYKTHQEKLEHGWSPADPWHQMSPRFVYNQINGGGDYGSWYGDAFELMCRQGCAPAALAQYNASDCTGWPSEAAYDSALYYRGQDWNWFSVTDQAGIQAMKQRLASGDCVTIDFEVFPNYDNITGYDTTYCVADLSGSSRGGHANCVVGYDDQKVTHDGVGAFRVVNSWGTAWGNQGYYWLSYQAMINSEISYCEAYYCTDRAGYTPMLKARLAVAHGRRDQVSIQLGIGTPAAPAWSTFFYGSYGGGGHPFPPNTMVFDLTDGAAALDTMAPSSLFVRCVDQSADGVTGTIQHFSASHRLWQTSMTSRAVPLAMADVTAPADIILPFPYRSSVLAVGPAVSTVGQGQATVHHVRLDTRNNYTGSDTVWAEVLPPAGQGQLALSLASTVLHPTDSCALTVTAASTAALGAYPVRVWAADRQDSSLRQWSDITVWVIGSGQALSVGGNSRLKQLLGSQWTPVDSIPAIPPVIGPSYQAIAIQDNATPGDSAALRRFVESGGTLLLTGTAPSQLGGISDLSGIASWLGAGTYLTYWGTGLPVIADRQNPFGLECIHVNDTLGMAIAKSGRLLNLRPGAIGLGHLGQAAASLTAVYNQYGTGYCFWCNETAGQSSLGDSLICGYLRSTMAGVAAGNRAGPPPASGIAGLSVWPNPVRARAVVECQTAVTGPLSVRVYDITGRLVRTLFAGLRPAGICRMAWDGRDDHGRSVAAGVYLVRLASAADDHVAKLVVVR